MKRDYLGDSYDAVKRLWQQVLAERAPLYADPRFLPEDLRNEFFTLTSIPVLTGRPVSDYSLLNDPDTGIRLPGEDNQSEGRTHISVRTIAEQVAELGPRCVITFDQSDYRQIDLKRDQQRRIKLRELRRLGLFGFYYVSHAPFLFAFPDTTMLDEVEDLLIKAGIPDNRLEKSID